jgi:hypothetical protein
MKETPTLKKCPTSLPFFFLSSILSSWNSQLLKNLSTYLHSFLSSNILSWNCNY